MERWINLAFDEALKLPILVSQQRNSQCSA